MKTLNEPTWRRSIRARGFALPLLALLLAGVSSASQANIVSLTGTFVADDELATIPISMLATGDISALTFSYNGGTNGAGQVIAGGGFAPVLSLFDDLGNLVQSGLTVPCVPAPGGFCWDVSLSLPGAPAGHYALALSQDGNFPLGMLADGFSMTGQPHYTAQYLGGGDPGATFIQIDGAQRTGQWALDLSVSTAGVPEPATWALLMAGLAVMGFTRRAMRG